MTVPRSEVQVYVDDDDGYLAWLAANQYGWVVNAYRVPDSRYLILHRATCHTITGTPARGSTWTEGDFSKICCDDQTALKDWCRRHGDPTPCGVCHP